MAGIGILQEHQKSRLVFNFPGFEGNSLERQLERLFHHAESAGKVWGFEISRGDLIAHYGKPGDDNHAEQQFLTNGPNWQVSTRLVQFRWEDIIATYEKQNFVILWFKNMPKYLAFFADGSVFKYFRASLRYGIFTIYPLMLMLIFAAIGWFAGGFLLSSLMLSPLLATLLQAIFTLVVVVLASKWPGDYAYLNLTIADWGFARDMCKRSNPVIEARYQQFAATIAREIKASKADEVIFVGHSFGAVWATAALATALNADDDLLTGRKVTFFALGSSLLKISLVPKAAHYRDHARRIFSTAGLMWHEVQTRIDLIAFYKADPVKAMMLWGKGHKAKAEIVLERLSYKKFMTGERYRKMRKSYYRTHRQYILSLDKRTSADLYLKLFGPFSSHGLARHPEIIAQIDAQGRLIDNFQDGAQ